MATVDFRIKSVFFSYVIPVVLLIVSAFIVVKCLLKSKNKIGAWLMNKFCYRLHKKLLKEKTSLFQSLNEEANVCETDLSILEIGAGSGLNFKFYPEGSKITCLDPNRHHKKYIEQNLSDLNPKVELESFVCGFGEDMKCFKDNQFDVVVETLVFCSVFDVQTVLMEIKRVLKPGGKLYFLDHVGAQPRTYIRWFQDKLNFLWRILCDRCNLNREIAVLIHNAGFSQVEIHPFDFKTKILLIKPFIYGIATN